MTHLLIDTETPNRHAQVLTFLDRAEVWFDDPNHPLFDSDSLVEAFLFAWMRYGGVFPDTWGDTRLRLVETVFQEFARQNPLLMMIYNN